MSTPKDAPRVPPRFEEDSARGWLEALFEGVPGLIEVRPLPCCEDLRAFASSPEEALAAIERAALADANVYVAIATRRDSSSGRKENTAAVRAVYADLDAIAGEDLAALSKRVEAFPLPPSLIVGSGGGLHLYWLLEQPLDLTNPDTLAHFERTLRGVAAVLDADPAAAEAARVLRPPGTLNLPNTDKQAKGRTVAPVRLLKASGVLYPLELRGRVVLSEASANAGGEKVREGGRHPFLLSLAGTLRKRGLEEAALIASLRAVNQAQCEPPLGDKEVEAIARWAARKEGGRPYVDERLRAEGETAEAEPASAAASRAVLISLESVTPERVSWLWEGFIPLGKLTVIDGDPGLGKSTLSCDLAARVSTGRLMPDGTPGILGGVVLLSAEDGLSDTICPRLMAAGADLSRIVFLRGMRTDHGERLPEIPCDLAALEQAIRESGALLVVVDPVMAFLGGDVNAHRDQDVRRALAPLARLAERTGAAIVVLRHLNKTAGTAAIYRGGGSIAIAGAARSVLLVANDPEDEDRRVLASIKANLATEPNSLSFRVVGAENGAAVIEWLGQSEHSASTLIAAPADGPERASAKEARQFLSGFLQDGPRTSKETLAAARAAGISPKQLERARQTLGVRPRRRGFQGAFEYTLPAQSSQSHQVGSVERLAGKAEFSNLPNLPTSETGKNGPDSEKGGHPPAPSPDWFD
jgi:hypothetical protein